ncbi:MAG TPA: transcription antitermination factor NusB [Actinomycetota bacterium]|nr:transcription antitermination factor NusB [Actinomycetota bacterium]
MKPRSAARRLALDVLYEAEIRDLLPNDAFSARVEQGWVDGGSDERDGDPDVGPSPDAIEYARYLVGGVQEHHAEIDRLIVAYADHWTIERMPVVDRNVIRIALFELMWGADVPVPVAINEAVELVKSLSTDDSGRFVNGLLGRIAETHGTEA